MLSDYGKFLNLKDQLGLSSPVEEAAEKKAAEKKAAADEKKAAADEKKAAADAKKAAADEKKAAADAKKAAADAKKAAADAKKAAADEKKAAADAKTAVAEAETAVAEAETAVAEAETAVAEAETAVAEAETAVAEAQAVVLKAQVRAKEAKRALAQALDESKEASKNLNGAQHKELSLLIELAIFHGFSDAATKAQELLKNNQPSLALRIQFLGYIEKSKFVTQHFLSMQTDFDWFEHENAAQAMEALRNQCMAYTLSSVGMMISLTKMISSWKNEADFKENIKDNLVDILWLINNAASFTLSILKLSKNEYVKLIFNSMNVCLSAFEIFKAVKKAEAEVAPYEKLKVEVVEKIKDLLASSGDDKLEDDKLELAKELTIKASDCNDNDDLKKLIQSRDYLDAQIASKKSEGAYANRLKAIDLVGKVLILAAAILILTYLNPLAALIAVRILNASGDALLFSGRTGSLKRDVKRVKYDPSIEGMTDDPGKVQQHAQARYSIMTQNMLTELALMGLSISLNQIALAGIAHLTLAANPVGASVLIATGCLVALAALIWWVKRDCFDHNAKHVPKASIFAGVSLAFFAAAVTTKVAIAGTALTMCAMPPVAIGLAIAAASILLIGLIVTLVKKNCLSGKPKAAAEADKDDSDEVPAGPNELDGGLDERPVSPPLR